MTFKKTLGYFLSKNSKILSPYHFSAYYDLMDIQCDRVMSKKDNTIHKNYSNINIYQFLKNKTIYSDNIANMEINDGKILINSNYYLKNIQKPLICDDNEYEDGRRGDYYDTDVNLLKYERKKVGSGGSGDGGGVNDIQYISKQNLINEEGYLQAIRDIIAHGYDRTDRTGVGTKSLFGVSFRYDLGAGFPLMTTKKLHFRSILEEWLWFMRGSTNIKELQDRGVHIWDGNDSDEFRSKIKVGIPLEKGDLGPGYGFQFRHFGAIYGTCKDNYEGQGVDQIKYVVDLIKNNPYDRRMVVSLWNPVDIPNMLLPPCHILYHFWVSSNSDTTELNEVGKRRNGNKINRLNCSMYQRSGDICLGIPFNVASSALFISAIARLTGLGVGELVHTVGDCHIYNNHIEHVKPQLERECLAYPKLVINPDKSFNNIEDFKYEDFMLYGYQYHDAIKFPFVA